MLAGHAALSLTRPLALQPSTLQPLAHDAGGPTHIYPQEGSGGGGSARLHVLELITDSVPKHCMQ